jgi:hypothetical protein
MKKLRLIFLLLYIMFHLPFAKAQVPEKMNYQAIARNSSGVILPSQNIGIRITITNGNSGPTVYQETHTVTTNQFGLFTLSIGSGTPVTGTFAVISWDSIAAWMQVEMDPSGGVAYVNMGTSQLLSVPYALNAATSNNINGTTNYIMKFTSPGIGGNSLLYDNGYSVSLGTTTPTGILNVENSYPDFSIYVHKTGSGESVNFEKDNPSSITANVTMSYNGQAATLESHSTGPGVAGIFDGGSLGSALSSIGTSNLPMANFSNSGPGAALAVPVGSVGIGTSTPSPNALLDVASTLKNGGIFTSSLAIGSSSSTNYFNQPAAIKGLYSASGANDGSGILGIANTTASGYGIGVIGFGNWFGVAGIGSALSTAGMYAYDNGSPNALYVSGELYLNGNFSGTGIYTYTSDAKFKKNIVPINNAIELLQRIKPSSYQFKTEEFNAMRLPGGKHFGVIAQELMQVIPELVVSSKFIDPEKKEDSFNYLSVNYTELIPILIKGIQEQQGQIDQLKDEIIKLKNTYK